jgi:hypothetical protein
MPSVTTWTRLEPRAREDDVQLGLQARVRDPLWLLARQWQFGEFKGEDAGSPVAARIEADAFGLTRFYPRPLGLPGRVVAPLFDGVSTPLETMVERESMRAPNTATLRLSADAGLHFARLLAANNLGQYRAAYLTRFALQVPTPDLQAAYDPASLLFLAPMAGRVIDGVRLFLTLQTSQSADAGLPGLPPDPAIPAADRDRAKTVVQTWLTWYAGLASEPAADAAPWVTERMEYEFAVSAATPSGEVVLSAPEYVEGRLDWYSFGLRPGASLGATAAETRNQDIRVVTIPAPVTYKGMPADRWWEFENAQIDFGAVGAGPADLVPLVLAEFALIYGNDWYVVPLEVNVGSLCRVRSLVLTNSFGDQVTIAPFTSPSAPAGAWRMFSLSPDRRYPLVGTVPQGFLFVPPVLAASLNSQPVEDLWLLRDEIANLAWAVERTVENRAGDRLDRQAAYLAQPQAAQHANVLAAGNGTGLSYRLASEVPDYWIPLVPVPDPSGVGSIRLQRGALARPGPNTVVPPRGRLLGVPGALFVRDEEVPRAGAHVTSGYQYARWIDGSSHLWRGRRKLAGRGEGSSGLRFDSVAEAPIPGASPSALERPAGLTAPVVGSAGDAVP